MLGRLVTLGALMALLAVGFGAIGAHVFAPRLQGAALHTWETAARYHLTHSLALIVAGAVSDRWPGRAPVFAAGGFLLGIVAFCGSLYALALGGPSWLGVVAPFGGMAFVAGWGGIAVAAAGPERLRPGQRPAWPVRKS